MLSWAANRVSVVLVFLMLTTASVGLIRTIENTAAQREVVFMADRLASRINAHLGLWSEAQTVLELGHGHDIVITLRPRSVHIEVDRRTASSPILGDLRLWDPQDRREWTEEEFTDAASGHDTLQTWDTLVLDTRCVRVGGVAVMETFAYMRV